MADNESRFKRTIRSGDKEESVDLLTLAMKRGAEYDKVCDALESLTSKETFPDFLDLMYFVKQFVAL